jgi:hypothetical protein
MRTEPNEDDDLNDIFQYQKSGLICEVCGYDDSLRCSIDFENPEDDEILCGEHAAKAGYCCCCGQFCAGMTSFDFHHPGYCDNCYDQIKADCGEDDQDDDEDYWQAPY